MKKVLFFCSFMLLSTLAVLGNKTSVQITVPENAGIGSDIKIVIQVTHSGNSKFHFTDWVTLKINGEEVKRWEYDKNNLPDDENFTLEFTYHIDEAFSGKELLIEAQGNCNVHGSTGEDKVTVTLQ